MIQMLSRTKKWLSFWHRDESGVIAVELAFVMPAMLALIVMSVGYFGAFRKEVVIERASLAIADLLGRKMDYGSDIYIDGLAGIIQFMTNTRTAPFLLVTALKWIAVDPAAPETGDFEVVWSEIRNGASNVMDDPMAKAFEPRLSMMAHDQRVIVVETRAGISTPVSLKQASYTHETFDLVFPLFVDRVCFKNDASDPNAAMC
jgi:hypothetical protein